ncbi:MAG: substrate-binding domain-containing protein [Kiritimatiellia bacterium]
MKDLLMKDLPHKTILVAKRITGASGRNTLSGILRSVGEGRPWHLRLSDISDRLAEFLATEEGRKIDGIILRYPEDPKILSAISDVKIPIVFTNYRREPEPGLPTRTFITLDDAAIGRAAAACFREIGVFATFAFATNVPTEPWSIARRDAFFQALPKKDAVFRELVMRERDDVAKFLRKAPKPIAVFASWDMVSMSLAELCRTIRLRIPSQVAILGVDNEELICNGVSPTLSSIEPNHNEVGYRACEELDRLFRGRPGRRVVIADAVRAIHRRESTAVVPPAELLVLRAKEYIQQNAGRAVTPTDVVRHLGVSRSIAYLRFQEREGEPIGAAITRARIEHVKRRLKSSRNTLSAIAAECGFPGSSEFSNYFKRATGLSPSAWRGKRSK